MFHRGRNLVQKVNIMKKMKNKKFIFYLKIILKLNV